MTRAVSVLAVAEEGLWAELAPYEAHLGEVLDPLRRVVPPSFEREVLPELSDRVLVRYARRTAQQVARDRSEVAETVAALVSGARGVLAAAQRHAADEVVVGRQAWDPVHDAAEVRALLGAGLLMRLDRAAPELEGPYRLHPDLPDPPPIPYDWSEAVMGETDDLPPPLPGPVALLHDLAALAAALHRVDARRTHAGPVMRTDARKLGRALAAAELAEDGRLEADARWSRALRALEALGAVSMDPIQRVLQPDVGLDDTLRGATPDVVDRLVRRLLDRDLHPVVPAVRTALQQAGDGAVDELVFLELLEVQHRDVLFPRWLRDGLAVYPTVQSEAVRAYDAEGFARFEVRMVKRALRRLEHLGLVRLAEGVFAPTADGRLWAGAPAGPRPPVWVSSDLEIIVPPGAITPWERYQLERLGRCLQRDVADRLKLERRGLAAWLATHDLDEALELLRRRSPALPTVVVETLEAWGRSCLRVTLTRGVLLED